MNKVDMPGLSPLWLVILAMTLGTTIVVLMPAAIATGDQIKTQDWIAFAGNVLSGAMTLLAGTMAWFAVQKQISADKEIARLDQTEAWEVVKDDLGDIVSRINVFWMSVDHALERAKNEDAQFWRFDNISEYYHQLPDRAEIERLERAAELVGLKRGRRIGSLANILKELDTKVANFCQGPRNGQKPLIWKTNRAPSLRLMLTIFAKEMALLDPNLSQAFQGRVRSGLDPLTRGARLEQSWRETLENEEWVERRH
jgi:hypothetical protein